MNRNIINLLTQIDRITGDNPKVMKFISDYLINKAAAIDTLNKISLSEWDQMISNAKLPEPSASTPSVLSTQPNREKRNEP